MSKAYNCPICNQYMDLIVTSHRTKPFIDGNLYPRMCFGCYHTPAEYVTIYDKNDNIQDTIGPTYSHRQLNTAEELFQNGATNSLKEAETCVKSVKKCIKAIGIRALDKLKLSRPAPIYERNPDHEKQQLLLWQKKKKKK